MAQQEDSTEIGKEEKIAAWQKKIKSEIAPHILEIQKILDSLTTFMGKEDFQDSDLEGAFDTTDAIQEQLHEIEELLFNLRDTIR